MYVESDLDVRDHTITVSLPFADVQYIYAHEEHTSRSVSLVLLTDGDSYTK